MDTREREQLEHSLAYWDSWYDSERQMVREVLHSPGYHTRIPDGELVCSTRTNLNYAVQLLAAGGPDREARAAAVIAQVLALQDRDPTRVTYGIWPWFAEEPLEKMAPPDWNWADFCGAAVGHALVEHAAQLPAVLLDAMRQALGHAGWSIFRRNVGPGYTNIAIMGSGISALAGETLGEPRLLDYGRTRLRRFRDYTAAQGGFNEYNSPTYTIVALNELERILQLVHDPQMRSDAEELRQMTWKFIATQFHPATQQWAGPHSRTYAEWIDSDGVDYLSAAVGRTIALHPRADQSHELQLIHPLPCPLELRERFERLPAAEVSTRQVFVRRPDGSVLVEGTTWMDGEACLGSASRGLLWTQRRPLLAYWRTPQDPAVVLRVRFLKDGRDFASAFLQARQEGRRVLFSVRFVENYGDFHPTLDLLVGGAFEAADLRVRCELTGAGARVDRVAQGCFALSAGSYRAVLRPLAGQFEDRPIDWITTQNEDQAWVEAVCWAGERRAFNIRTCGRALLAAGLELLRAREAPAREPVLVQTRAEAFRIAWDAPGQDLHLDGELQAENTMIDW